MILTAEHIKPIVSQITEVLRDEISRNASPWADRKGAASYCACSVPEIDRAVARGDIERYRRGETPMFKKHGGKGSLDAWIEGKAK